MLVTLFPMLETVQSGIAHTEESIGNYRYAYRIPEDRVCEGRITGIYLSQALRLVTAN
jgi:hypothetical protein